MPSRKEILLKAENNRQAIFDAIGNEVLKLTEIDAKTGIGEGVIKNHINTLLIRGHLNVCKLKNEVTNKLSNFYRQTDKPYIAKTENELDISKEEKKEYTKRYASDLEAMKENPNLQIYRRLDTKIQSSKRSSQSSYKGIGSSFSMWESA